MRALFDSRILRQDLLANVDSLVSIDAKVPIISVHSRYQGWTSLRFLVGGRLADHVVRQVLQGKCVLNVLGFLLR